MYYVYVLYSKKDKHLYYGFSPHLRERYAKHKAGKVLATKGRLPVILIYFEGYINEADARARERYFKSGWGRAYIQKILVNTLKGHR